jgi:uncharacterized protein
MRDFVVGEVKEAWIYPFKGMAGVQRHQISLKSVSVVGDRARAFNELDTSRVPTTVDTIRFPELLLYRPELVDPIDPEKFKVLTPDYLKLDPDSAQLLAEASQRSSLSLSYVGVGRALYHSMPLSLLSLASIAGLENHVHTVLDPRRFRENVIVRTVSEGAFNEDGWLGKILTFGDRPNSARVIVVKRDKRCETINMNPDTTQRSPEILKGLADLRGKEFVQKFGVTMGVYASIAQEGTIEVGDRVYMTYLS